jgi:3-oxoacyl-[acyl-carrier-protein] synthase-3
LLSNLPDNKLGLLLVGDISTICLSENDRGTVPLFSDAASATLIQKTGEHNPWYFSLHNDGSGASAIKMFDTTGNKKPEFVGNSFLKLDGIKIYNFSLRQVVPSIIEFLDRLNLSREEIDFFVFHQASKIINEAIRRKLDIPRNKYPYSLEEYGNTSSATVPLTMVTQMAEELKSDHSLLLSGFGTGLSWGSVFLKTGPIDVIPLVEI